MFILISRLSVCEGYQNLWIFVLGIFVTIPFNVGLLPYVLLPAEYILELGFWAKLITVPIVYCSMLSVEEMLLGIVGRLLWRCQYELHFK